MTLNYDNSFHSYTNWENVPPRVPYGVGQKWCNNVKSGEHFKTITPLVIMRVHLKAHGALVFISIGISRLFDLEPQDSVVATGGTLRFQCQINSSTHVSYTWIKDRHSLFSSERLVRLVYSEASLIRIIHLS